MTLEQIIEQWFWDTTQDLEQLTPDPGGRIQDLANRIREAGWVSPSVFDSMTKHFDKVAAEVPIPTAVLSLLNQIENLTFDDDYSTAMNLISDNAKEAMDILTKGRGGYE